MAQPYYNASYGNGLEGFMNYANLLVDGWMVNAFLFFVFTISVYVLNKSEWKTSGVVSFSFFMCFITALIFRLFTVVNEMTMFIIIIGLAGSIFWSILNDK